MAGQHDHSHHHGSHDCSTEHDDDDDSRWVEMERLYQDKSTEEQSIINWFAEHVKDYLPIDISPDAKFSILSFGCGNGTKDQGALRAIVSNLAVRTKVFYCAVDPDEKSIEKFKEAVKEESERSTSLLNYLKDVNFDFHVQTYESYVETKASAEECGQGMTSDLILLINSLCHFSCDLNDALVHCYERELSSNGVIVIFLWNGDDFWFKIRKRLSDGTKVDSPDPDQANDCVTVQDVLRIAEENKWRFQMHPCQYHLDVSECFKPDSEQGVKILECLDCYSNLQGTVADISGGGLLEFLHDEAEWKGSARVLNGNLGVLVIYK